MGLINSLANRAYSTSYSISFLSVSMTSEITYEVSGGEVPVYSPKTASVVLITAINLPLTYRCKPGDSQVSILHCVHTTAIERFQNRSIADVSYTGVSPRAPIRPLLWSEGRACLL
jgi:hypothetical protein